MHAQGMKKHSIEIRVDISIGRSSDFLHWKAYFIGANCILQFAQHKINLFVASSSGDATHENKSIQHRVYKKYKNYGC